MLLISHCLQPRFENFLSLNLFTRISLFLAFPIVFLSFDNSFFSSVGLAVQCTQNIRNSMDKAIAAVHPKYKFIQKNLSASLIFVWNFAKFLAGA